MAINFSSIGSQLSQATSQFSQAIPQITTITQNITQGLNGFNTLLNAPEFNLSIPAMNFGNVFSQFSNNFDVALNQNLNQFQQQINTTLAGMDQSLTANIPNISFLSSGASTGINQITSQINGNISQFTSQLGQISNQVTAGFPTQVGQLGSALGQIQTGISQFQGSITNFSSIMNGFTGNLNSALGQLSGASSQLSGALPGISNQITGITSQLTGASSQITSNLTSFNSQLTTGISQLQSRIGNIQNIASALSNPGQFISNKISDFVNLGLQNLLGPISNLTSAGSNLAQSILGNSSINVLTRTLDQLQGLTGSQYESATTAVQNRYNQSDVLRFINGNNFDSSRSINGAELKPSRITNPLRNHNHYNYIISLGCLSRDEFNTRSYLTRKTLPAFIIRSGGGMPNTNYATRTRTSDEERLQANLEYFIEDLELDAIVAPNTNTGPYTATNIRFKVIEPYSLGQFLESLIVASEEAGYNNYMSAVFCLQIEFKGWDEYGKGPGEYVRDPIFIPVALTKADLSVTEQGSVYDVEAIAYNDVATEDRVNETKTQLQASGEFVHQILQTGLESVTETLNTNLELLEETNNQPTGDRYIIAFPKNVQDIYNLTSGLTAASASSASQNVTTPRSNGSGSQTNLYDILKAYAQDESLMNDIGKSGLIEDTRNGADVPHPSPSQVVVDGNVTVSGSGQTIQEKVRIAQYDAGTSITGIIENIILNSVYATTTATEDMDLGRFSWFRIEPMVFIESVEDGESTRGRPAYTYVYAVHQYFPDESKIMGPNSSPRNTQVFKDIAPKEYNYYYTGQNEDIIDFNVNFNFAFYNAVLTDSGSGRDTAASQSAATPDQLRNTTARPASASSRQNGEAPSQTVSVTELPYQTPRGFRSSFDISQKTRIAEMFHSRLMNAPNDMITAEMEIWGDPYFLPNYQGGERINPGASSDGLMSYMTDEVMVVINFRTPLDYQVNGFVMDFPELVRPFSGLYFVLSTTSIFSDGVFKQKLQLSRRARQNDSPTSNNAAVRSGGDGVDTISAIPGSLTTAQARRAVEQLAGVGFGDGLVDGPLAAAVLRQTGSFTDNLGNTVTVSPAQAPTEVIRPIIGPQ